MAEIMVSTSSGAIQSILGKLATLMGEEFAKLKNLRKEVKFISDELTSMKDALEGISNQDEIDPQTKRWRDIVRELSYDIENILDDFIRNVGESNKGFISNTVQRLKTLRARHKIVGQIEDIKNLVTEASDRHQRYKLDAPLYKLPIPLSGNVVIDPRVVTLYENAANLVGMKVPMSELVNQLVVEDKHLLKVSIVGFGGLGKTTLANMVYSRLKENFKYSGFVSVSQKPDIRKLLRNLLSQLGSKSSHDCELNVLLDQLREHLQNDRYLIVIDDIWDVQAWGVIKCAFPENDRGSRVIVTTRIQDVAKACCSQRHDHIFNMKPLSNKDSRRLFFGRIFGSEEACPQHLREVSVEILKKCGGLPLAIGSISSMLASEGSNQKERWEHVRDSVGSGTNLTLEGVRQILNLSYRNLPSQLKTCLLYLGMYPEDYTIKRSELEHQWIAEGFVCKESGQDMDKIARNYFNELVNRSLIQPVSCDNEGSVTECKVHDMMLDLILLKSVEDNFLTVVDGPESLLRLDHKVRRLSFQTGNARIASVLPGNISISQVRSVMFFGSSDLPPLSEFKFLRVFFVDSFVLFRGLDKLYQLRYFGSRKRISHTNVVGAVHLPRLLHLSVGYGSELPEGIVNMKSILTLSGFNILIHSPEDIKCLGELTSITDLTLTGKGMMYLCQDDIARRLDALGSSLQELCKLESLYLYTTLNMDGLFASCPIPLSLERLHTGEGKNSSRFSRVPIMMEEHKNLRDLQLQVTDLHKEDVGILAALPSLVILELTIINDMKQMVVINGGFPVLKCFAFAQNRASYLTFKAGAMPKLQMLKLSSDNSRYLPAGIEHLPSLEKVSAHMKYYQTDYESRAAESALRSYISIHPRNLFLEEMKSIPIPVSSVTATTKERSRHISPTCMSRQM